MKKNTGSIKRRIVATALAVLTMSSITSASAAVNASTLNSSVHMNANSKLLNKKQKSNEDHTAKINEILDAVREYKKEKSESAKAEAISKRKDKIEKYTTAGVKVLTNIAKGEYIDAVTTVINFFPYGEAISTAINFISELCSSPEDPTYVPSVTLEDIENQLTDISNALNSMSEDIKLIKNQKFTESFNEIIRIYNIASDDILAISQQKFKVANAQENLSKAKESEDEAQIKNAQAALDKEVELLAKKQKKVNVISEDTAILRKSIQTCTQYMMSKTLDGVNDNPFLSYLDAKLSGLPTGSLSNSTIEECVKRDEKIWNFYNAGVALYAICETNNINRLANSGDPDKQEEAEKYTRQFVKFMTGVTPNMDNNTSSKNTSNFSAADVYDYYMNEILPEEMKMADKYKFEDGSWDTKVADVTCENKTKMFRTFDDAWKYATSYTNTTIDLYKDLKINEAYSTSNKIKNNITIDLNGVTIDCKNKTNAFVLKNKGKFEIKSSGDKATFVNGYADNGGAIENLKSDFSIKNCKFVSNKAKNGGAVYTSSMQNTKLSNCDFVDNNASVDGGAIYGKDIKIIYENRLPDVCPVVVDNCTFNNNSADNNGGAVKSIYLIAGNSKFTDNTAKIHGGAVYSSDYTKVSDSSFENNRANGGDGGAIGSKYEGYTVISNADFNSNYSYGNGGAVSSAYYTRTEIYNSTFTNNISENKGGAIYLGELQAYNHSLNNVTITGNKAKNQGGGIYANTAVAAAGDIDLNGTVIIKDNADFNGNNSNARMIYAAAKKAKFYVQKGFNVADSDIYVTSNSNDTAVAELLKKTDEKAFHADKGSLKRGNFYDKTLYFYN